MVFRIHTDIKKKKTKYFHSYACKIPSKETWKYTMKLLPGLTSGEKTKTGVRDGEWLRTFILLYPFMQRTYLYYSQN